MQKWHFFLQDMAMQGPAKGFGRKIPQIGFGIAQVPQKHNKFKIGRNSIQY